MSPLRMVFPVRKSIRPKSWTFLNSVNVAVAEPSHAGSGLPQYTAGAVLHGTAGPPPREKFVPGTSGPLSHIMLMALGVTPLLSMSADSTRRWKMLPSGKPGTWYWPKVAFMTNDGAPPRVTTSLALCENLTPTLRAVRGERTSSALRPTSTPRLSTSPMLRYWTPGKPSDGSAGTCTSASFVFLLYQVNSSATRWDRSE